MFSLDLVARRNKFLADFRDNRKKYVSFGLVSIFVFLTIIYLGPFGGLERLGLIGKKKEEQKARAAAGDKIADVIIGRRDFTDVLSRGYVNPKWLDRPGGAVVDRNTAGSTLGYLYVQSTRENRIIALNLDNCIPQNVTCSAEKVFGQPSATDYSACNGDSSFQSYPNRAPASSSSLCFVKEDALSTAENLSFIGMHTAGGNLYVPDTENHRVLVYYNAWNDQVADEVIGQDDFSGNLCNKSTAFIISTTPSASSLCLLDYSDTANSQSGVALDSAGNLWVADTGNHRVLRFPKNPTTGKFSKTADIVLGQPNFTTGPGHFGSGLNQMNNPNSLRFDPSGNLYVSDGVADGGNARVLKFTPAEQKIAGTATVFARSTSFVSEIDPINGGIWIMSSPHLLLYGFDGSLKKDMNIGGQFIVGSVGVAKNGGVVVPSATQGVVFINNPLTKASGWDRELFDPKSSINKSRLNQVHGVAIVGNKLFVSDVCRILFWNDPMSLTNGKDADGVLIQPNFTSYDCNINFVASLKADSDNHLWVKTRKGIYVYDANAVSPTGTAPIKIIADPVPVLGGGTLSVLTDNEGLHGFAPQTVNGSPFLWVSDSYKNRVVRIRNPLTNPVVDVILGQQNLVGTSCNQGATSLPNLTMLCRPGALSIDKSGNLYVSDHSLEVEGNWRLLMFSASTFSTNNASLLFNPAATKEFPRAGGQTHATWEPAFDSQNHMVVGYNGYAGGRFVGYYLNPTDPNKKQPDGYFKDYYSMPFGATFDAGDNLYITDINRPRVMIYKNPFNTSVPTPSAVSSPSPVASPSASFSPLPSFSPSPVLSPSPTPSDTQLPKVTISQPLDQSTVSGIATIGAVASDNVAVSKIEIYVDGGLIATVNNTTSIFVKWNTNPKKVTAGTHIILAKAYDAAGNVGSVQISANVAK